MSDSLPTTLINRVDRLCSEGSSYINALRFDAAVIRFKAAFDLLPQPREQWTSTSRILAGITDACFLKGDLKSAQEAIDATRGCPRLGNTSRLHLRQGQIHFELGELDEAVDELVTAYKLGSDSLFADENPKYLQFVHRHL